MVTECHLKIQNFMCFSIDTTLFVSSCEDNDEPSSKDSAKKKSLLNLMFYIKIIPGAHRLAKEAITCDKNHYIRNCIHIIVIVCPRKTHSET